MTARGLRAVSVIPVAVVLLLVSIPFMYLEVGAWLVGDDALADRINGAMPIERYLARRGL